MRHQASVPILVATIVFCAVVFVAPPGQVALAVEPDFIFAGADPWTMEAEAGRSIWIVEDYEDGNIDGVPQLTNVDFYHQPTESIDRIHVYNWDSATARYDTITFATPPPGMMIFSDDFERTSTCRWSSTTP